MMRCQYGLVLVGAAGPMAQQPTSHKENEQRQRTEITGRRHTIFLGRGLGRLRLQELYQGLEVRILDRIAQLNRVAALRSGDRDGVAKIVRPTRWG
jgi:hypothetical protein